MLWSRAPSPPTAQAFPGALLSTSVSFVHTSALQTQVAPGAAAAAVPKPARVSVARAVRAAQQEGDEANARPDGLRHAQRGDYAKQQASNAPGEQQNQQ